MLKRIDLADVELGMFIHKLEGSWFKHPFWKSRFLLRDPDMLADLQASDIPGVVIDTAKGLDQRPVPARRSVAPARPDAIGAPAAAVRPAQRARASFSNRPSPVTATDLRSTAPLPMRREFGMASAVADRSRKVVSRIFLEARLGKAIKTSQVEPVINNIFNSIQRNPHAFNGLMRCKRDNEYVYRHALAVSALMISLARHLKMAPERIQEAGMAGLLMDVGIGHLPVDLSQYGGDYRNLPPEILQRHVMLGYEFVQAGGGMPPGVLSVCLLHHETLDGTGYPRGVGADEIDIFARMAAICDTYDSMVSDTQEGSGMNPAAAIAQMAMMKGWFDEAILQSFIETIGIYPIGSLVQLRSGRLALVVDQDANDSARPCVRAFYSIAEKQMLRPTDIALAHCYGEDEILGVATPEEFGIADYPRIREQLFASAAKGDGFTI